MPRLRQKFDGRPGRGGAPVVCAFPPRRERFDLKIGGHRVRLGERTVVCGILNVTPDSFSDGGLYLNRRPALRHALEMARAGADWIDIGGESTRPGSSPVSAEEELRRVLPVIRAVRRHVPGLPISIDTSKSIVAEQALSEGANIINDISGLRFDSGIAKVARDHGVPLILMHLRGRPATMQLGPFARDVWGSIVRDLSWSVERALALGVGREQLIVDPGLGFGKTRRQNFEVMAGLAALRQLRLPVLAGASRKSFIRAVAAGSRLDVRKRMPDLTALAARTRRSGQTPGRPPSDPTDFADAAAVAGLILAGAHIVRVHNVVAARQAARIADAMLSAAHHHV